MNGACPPGTLRKRGADLRDAGLVPDGAIVVEGETIAWVGRDADLPPLPPDAEVLDATGCAVLPGLVETVMGSQPFYNNKREGHVDLFNGIADKQFELALDHTIGQEWRALRPELNQTPEDAVESELDLWFGPRDAAPDFEPSEAEKRNMDCYFGPDL